MVQVQLVSIFILKRNPLLDLQFGLVPLDFVYFRSSLAAILWEHLVQFVFIHLHLVCCLKYVWTSSELEWLQFNKIVLI